MIGRKPVPHWLWLTKYPSSRRTTSEEIDVEVTRGLSREDWRVKSIRAGNDGAEKKNSQCLHRHHHHPIPIEFSQPRWREFVVNHVLGGGG